MTSTCEMKKSSKKDRGLWLIVCFRIQNCLISGNEYLECEISVIHVLNMLCHLGKAKMK